MPKASRKEAFIKWDRVIGNIVGVMRRGAGVTQEELALKLSWHRSKVVKVENGITSLRVAELIALSKAIGTDPSETVRRIANW